ncbi:MAG: tetratricopeptide repeat protein [Myxococcales bacterium]|nr:tetratricopeptide repeat protein [Myxococcales bacterium]
MTARDVPPGPDPARIEALSRTCAADPRSLHFVELGRLLLEAGDHRRAYDVLRTGLHHHPEHIDGHYHYGESRLRLGQLGPSIAEFEWVLRRAPAHVDALLALARAQSWDGRAHEARQTLERALAAAPDDPRPRAAIARLVETFTVARSLGPSAPAPSIIVDEGYREELAERDLSESITRESLATDDEPTAAQRYESLGPTAEQQTPDAPQLPPTGHARIPRPFEDDAPARAGLGPRATLGLLPADAPPAIGDRGTLQGTARPDVRAPRRLPPGAGKALADPLDDRSPPLDATRELRAADLHRAGVSAPLAATRELELADLHRAGVSAPLAATRELEPADLHRAGVSAPRAATREREPADLHRAGVSPPLEATRELELADLRRAGVSAPRAPAHDGQAEDDRRAGLPRAPDGAPTPRTPERPADHRSPRPEDRVADDGPIRRVGPADRLPRSTLDRAWLDFDPDALPPLDPPTDPAAGPREPPTDPARAPHPPGPFNAPRRDPTTSDAPRPEGRATVDTRAARRAAASAGLPHPDDEAASAPGAIAARPHADGDRLSRPRGDIPHPDDDPARPHIDRRRAALDADIPHPDDDAPPRQRTFGADHALPADASARALPPMRREDVDQLRDGTSVLPRERVARRASAEVQRARHSEPPPPDPIDGLDDDDATDATDAIAAPDLDDRAPAPRPATRRLDTGPERPAIRAPAGPRPASEPEREPPPASRNDGTRRIDTGARRRGEDRRPPPADAACARFSTSLRARHRAIDDHPAPRRAIDDHPPRPTASPSTATPAPRRLAIDDHPAPRRLAIDDHPAPRRLAIDDHPAPRHRAIDHAPPAAAPRRPAPPPPAGDPPTLPADPDRLRDAEPADSPATVGAAIAWDALPSAPSADADPQRVGAADSRPPAPTDAAATR